MGSLIEVTYSMNPDKTDYKEERKVIKGYINSKEQGKKWYTYQFCFIYACDFTSFFFISGK